MWNATGTYSVGVDSAGLPEDPGLPDGGGREEDERGVALLNLLDVHGEPVGPVSDLRRRRARPLWNAQSEEGTVACMRLPPDVTCDRESRRATASRGARFGLGAKVVPTKGETGTW